MKGPRSVTPSLISSCALCEAPRATVRIVPSFGFITALYAVSTALSKLSASTAASSVSCSRATLVNPRRSCERITPELPRAPRSDPVEMLLQTAVMSSRSVFSTSAAADMIVIVMLVPVSPSGTGNTFNSLITSFFSFRRFAPARNMRERVRASILSVLIRSPNQSP